MEPVWSDSHGALWQGDVRACLAAMEPESVQCVVCSPPYWSLRNYGTDPQVWGGSAECAHDWRPVDQRVMTGGTGSASKKQVTKQGSQFGNSMKTAALASEMGSPVAVDQRSELPASGDAQVDLVGAAPLTAAHGQAVTLEQRHQPVGQCLAAAGEGSTPGLIDMAIAVENTAQEIPHNGIGHGGQAAVEALAWGDTEARQPFHQRLTPDAPAVGNGAALSDLFADSGLRRQEVTDEPSAAFIQADKANGASVLHVAVGDHQPEPVGQIGGHGVEAFPQDRIASLSADELSSMWTPRTGPRAEATEPAVLTVPPSAEHDLTASLAGDTDAGIGTSDGAPLTNADAGRPDVEGLSAGDAINGGHASMVCDSCGAIKCELGSEPLHDCAGWATGAPCGQCFVCHLLEVFTAVKRVLRPDGVCLVNLGDSYAANRSYQVTDNKHVDVGNNGAMHVPPGLKAKDLVGIPWRFALAMQAAGWWLRGDYIWEKSNPMPESVTDRCTRAHEYIFHFSKSATYFWDAESIRESAQYGRREWTGHLVSGTENGDGHRSSVGTTKGADPSAGRNARSVWNIPTHGFPEAHFATFPPELPRRAILAGTSERGACAACGAPWRRTIQRTGVDNAANEVVPDYDVPGLAKGSSADRVRRLSGATYQRVVAATDQWQPTCDHLDADVVPCRVLDIFNGSGTSMVVARALGRYAVGVELSEVYCEMALKRLQQGVLL